jgi:hemerythrin-like domain-containing protein
MEQKPIKRTKEILKLSREHHFSLLFCWKIRQGLKKEIATERIRNYVFYFWPAFLASHFREEEEVLFAPLPEDDLIIRALKEHAAIRESVEQLKTAAPDRQPELLESLAALVDDHVRFEERTLFPHIEKVLSREQLEAIGQQLDAAPPVEEEVFEDIFWAR